MNIETFPPGQWLIVEPNSEDSAPSYFLWKVLKGKVSIHQNGIEINALEIREDDSPIILGTIAAFTADRLPIASVRAESEVKAEQVYIDHIKGLIRNEIPDSLKKEVGVMIETIKLVNSINYSKKRLSDMPPVESRVPDGLSPEISEVLSDIFSLYGYCLESI